jgi:hypothetical protein
MRTDQALAVPLETKKFPEFLPDFGSLTLPDRSVQVVLNGW